MAGTLTLSGLACGLASGEQIIGPNTMAGGAIIGAIIPVTLVTGDNTVSVPPLAVAVAVFVPSTNTAEIKVRTNLNSFEAGLPINPSGPWFAWPLYTGTTSVILNAASGGATISVVFI